MAKYSNMGWCPPTAGNSLDEQAAVKEMRSALFPHRAEESIVDGLADFQHSTSDLGRSGNATRKRYLVTFIGQPCQLA